MRAIVRLFDLCGVSYEEWLDQDDNRDFVQSAIDEYWDESVEERFEEDDQVGNAFSRQAAKKAIVSFVDSLRDFNDEMGVGESPVFRQIALRSPEKVFLDNCQRADEINYQAEKDEDLLVDSSRSEEEKIHDLFWR